MHCYFLSFIVLIDNQFAIRNQGADLWKIRVEAAGELSQRIPPAGQS